MEQPGATRFPSPYEIAATAPATGFTQVLVPGIINLQPNLNGDIFDFKHIQVECGSWYQPGLVTLTSEELQKKLDASLLAVCGPQLAGELMQAMFWFLFDDE
jgi:hypothetical protein